MNEINKLPSKIRITIHRDEEGYFWAESLDIPHCYTQGKTLDETICNMKDAIFTYFEIPAEKSNLRLFKTEPELSAELRFART